MNGARATLKSLRAGAGPQVAYDEEPETSIWRTEAKKGKGQTRITGNVQQVGKEWL